MGDVISLNQVRKARAKAQAEKEAEGNRVTHGTPKDLKKKSRSEKKKSDTKLDGQRLDDKSDEQE